MTNEQVYDALNKMLPILTQELATPIRFPFWKKSLFPEDVRNHILWMSTEIKELIKQNKKEKAMRWLGFIQGVMWSQGKITIGELKEMNKPQEMNLKNG